MQNLGIEVWGGIECTVNRVRDRYFDQLQLSGHDNRIEDLDAIASLGIKRLRYPVLWELTAPDPDAEIDWRWADARLGRLRELGVEPIVGFVHHGSGPRHTSLREPSFAPGLARYAERFACRFPWVKHFTPINEPLTTARFSALYGHWYPHAADERTFARVLVNQCLAVADAMRAIRRIRSDAKLVQTDDLGRVYSTPRLAYQADFENTRRWVAWDLLCGRVDRMHPWAERLRSLGIEEEELASFIEHPCPPDIIGINHYLTSDRYLHDDRERFPQAFHGGNGRDVYADVEAVRIPDVPAPAVETLLIEAWERYRLPLAITEAHMGCTREEQLRWIRRLWRDAEAARAKGADVRAVTIWALLGSFNWDTLVTADTGSYEPGAFDVRGPAPRPTAVAHLTAALARGSADPATPLMELPGWWEREDRFLLPPNGTHATAAAPRGGASCPPLLICGATGTLGAAFARIAERRGLPYILCDRARLDIGVPDSISEALDGLVPFAVVNAAGYVRVDDAELECERCYRENAEGPRMLAEACGQRRIPLLTFSSDLVFDGEHGSPYRECDGINPINVYGHSKARAERAVLEAYPEALVVRTSAFFGPWDTCNFLTQALRALASGASFVAIDDLVVSPTYVPHLVDASLDLLIDRQSGLWHLANDGSTTWAQFAAAAAKAAGLSLKTLRTGSWLTMNLRARRPAMSALTSERGIMLPPLDAAVAQYLAETKLA